jgi:porin
MLKSLKLARVAGWAVLATALAAPAGAEDQDETGLLGAWGGLKPALAAHGVTLDISDSENLLGNVMGGVKTGATMQGVTTMTLEVDTGKAFGLQGGTFHVSALQLHGQPLSGPYLATIQAANGNEGENATRLWELWYDQATPDGRFDLKLGRQSIDNEFMGSDDSALFVNTMAGWPVVPSLDLYGGGPAYPLSSLGLRGQYKPDDSVTILAGMFDDDPGGGGFDEDQQALDPAGGRFNLNNGALWIAEIQYATEALGLPGTYKFGGWYDSATFPDQRYDAEHRGNYSLYGVVDQMVWRSAASAKRSLNLFGRIMGAPDDRNYIDFGFNGGVTLTAPFAGREDDQAGLDFGVAHVSSRAADAIADAGGRRPGAEYLIEATYQAQATPWLLLQPDLQYVIRPGGGIDDPLDPRRRLGNELVVGLRGVVTF